ncbi:MAG: DNA-processing protein DprA [Alphaproteobacteria bacterium]|nr:DNA-processing protein DprA [Alphaproteobacteria bacterium]
MTEQEKIDWLRLAFSENVGPATFRKLVKIFGTPKKALDNINDWAKQGGAKRSIQIAQEKAVLEQLDKAKKIGANFLLSCDDDYPKLLKQISDAPPVLFVLGHSYLLTKRCISIVGTRAATLNGKNFATHLAKELCEQDYVVISGMAKGIDRAAHTGALQNTNGKGGTIAVLGTAIDEIYPPENKDIYDEIKERGCLVSEFPFDTPLKPQNFPRRNRIISGLAEGVIVIEANLRSGSLITAKEALSQGREVFAVPGSPLDPRAAGPNALIQDGATLVTQTRDITDVLENNKSFHLSDTLIPNDYQLDHIPAQKEIDQARALVLENLSPEMIEIDELIRATNLDARLVHIVLTQLELAGRLEHFTGNRVALIYGDKE